MNAELKTHYALDRLLRKCLRLEAADERAVRRDWQLPPDKQRAILLRSAPDDATRLIAEGVLNQTFDFDLRGVPGFYLEEGYDLRDELAILCGLPPAGPSYYRWKLNLRPGGLVRPYYNERRRICGLVVYRSASDDQPRLLSSAKLYMGAKAQPYNPLFDHELIHEHRIQTPRSTFDGRTRLEPRREARRAAAA